MKKTLIFIALFAMLITSSAKADEEIVNIGDIEAAAPDEITDAIGGVEGASDTQSALSGLWESITVEVEKNVSKVLKRAFGVLAVAMICGMLGVFREGKAVPDWIDLCGCAAICAICLGDLGSYISMCKEALYDISSFSQALLPALCTLSAASGAVSSASVKFAGTALFMDMLITAALKLILPVILAFAALSVAAAAFDSKSLSKLCKLLKKLCVMLMTLLATGFTAYLGISSAISGAGDALALKSAKTIISTALPVVGGVISDAASGVIGAAELLKSTVGVFGMLTIAFICAAPFAVLGLNFIVFKAAAAGAAMLSGGRISELTDSVGDAFGMLLGLVGSAGIMMFISIMSSIKAVVS